MPPALETSAASVPLEVPSIGALMMMGFKAWGNHELSVLRVCWAILRELLIVCLAGMWCSDMSETVRPARIDECFLMVGDGVECL